MFFERCSLLLTAVIIAQLPLKLQAADWPQLLGPNRNGVVSGTKLTHEIPKGRPKLAWQAAVGLGSAPVVVSGERVFTFGLYRPGTTADNLHASSSMPTVDDLWHGTFPAGDLPGTPATVKKESLPAVYQGVLYTQCLDAANGKTVWATRLTDYGVAFKIVAHGGSGWELASPLLYEGKLYIHTHTGHLYCLDCEHGKLLWDVNLFEQGMSTWFAGQQGNSFAPLAAEGNVILGYEGANPDAKDKNPLRPLIAGFDAVTGAERWKTYAPFPSENAKTTRGGYAVINGQPTVLDSCGGGTIVVDPATGKIRWSYDLVAANPETMQKVPEEYSAPPQTAAIYRRDAMRSPFPGFCPLAWGNYVIDAACVGHNTVNSATWCMKITDGKATRVWQTSKFVPLSASFKSHMVIRDGRLYGFDAYSPAFTRGDGGVISRPYHGDQTGEFQCREVATGNLLWSSDAFNPGKPGRAREDSRNCSILLADELMIVTNNHGLWISRLEEQAVTILACVPQSTARDGYRMLSEPVLADGRLLVRQLDADPKSGLSPAFEGEGNLFAFDLRAEQK